jgi:hypothetical protein
MEEINYDYDCGMDWTDLTRDADQSRALVKMVLNLWVSYEVEKFLSICTTGAFSRRNQLLGVSYHIKFR